MINHITQRNDWKAGYPEVENKILDVWEFFHRPSESGPEGGVSWQALKLIQLL
jgi:hypothetical protein